MAKQGLFVKWGFVLLLLISSLSLAVWGAQPDIETTVISNFDVFEADLRDVFRSLAEYGKINILMDKQVQGTVTTRFQSGMSVRQAIEILAQTNGYSFRWLMPQRTVLIGNESSFKNIDVQQTRVYSLKYADPDTVMETLKVIVPKEQVGVDKRTNQLVVKANILELQNVEEVVSRLDRETPQISIELKIEEVSRRALEKVGVGWTEDAFSLDFKTPKISYVPGQILKLWEEKTNAKVLSKPMVATTDSKEAVIFIGDKLPVAKTTTDASGNSSTNIEYIDVGTKLFVTPRINNENIVTVNVKANLSNINGSTTIDGNPVPIVRNRETGSVIRLRDGETFMLSGLNQSESAVTESGLKGLNKIPLLGNLFKSKENDPNNDSEIVIFITPRILKMEKPPAEPVNTVNETKPVATSQKVAEPPAKKAETPVVPGQTSSVAAKPEAEAVALRPDESKVTEVPRPAVTAAVIQPDTKPEAGAVAPQPKETKVTEVPQAAVVTPVAAQPLDQLRVTVQVKAGDTLSNIALRYGVPKAVILKDNNLKPTDKLQINQELMLTIPQNHLYTLKPKETLWRIAKRYGVSVDTLKQINNLGDLTQLEAGMQLILPVSVERVVDQRF